MLKNDDSDASNECEFLEKKSDCPDRFPIIWILNPTYNCKLLYRSEIRFQYNAMHRLDRQDEARTVPIATSYTYMYTL